MVSQKAWKQYQKAWSLFVLWMIILLIGLYLGYFLYFANWAELSKPYPFYQTSQTWWEEVEQKDHASLVIELRQALDQYQIATEIFPHQPNYFVEYAMVAKALAKQESNAKLCQQNCQIFQSNMEKASQQMPRTVNLHIILGDIYQKQENWQQSDRHFAIALILQSQRIEALEHITRYWQTRWQSNPTQLHYQMLLQFSFYQLSLQNFNQYGSGILQFCRKNWPDLEVLGHVIPTQDIFLLQAARSWGELGEWHKALAILDRFPDTMPEKLCLLGHYALSQQDHLKAMDAYTKALQQTLASEKTILLEEILTHLTQQGDFFLALEWLKQQSDLGLAEQLQLCAVAISYGHIQDSIQYLHVLRGQNSTSSGDFIAESAFLLSQCYAKEHNYTQAVFYADEMIAQKPRVKKYAWYYCKFLWNMGLEGKIRDYLQIHHRYIDGVEEIYEWLTQQCLNKSQYNQAQYWIVQSLDLDPVSPVLRRRLETIRQKLSKP